MSTNQFVVNNHQTTRGETNQNSNANFNQFPAQSQLLSTSKENVLTTMKNASNLEERVKLPPLNTKMKCTETLALSHIDESNATKETGIIPPLPIEYIPLVINDGQPSRTLQRPKTGKSKVIIKITNYTQLAVPQTVRIHPHNLMQKFMNIRPKVNDGLAELYFKVTDGINDKALEICPSCKQREKEKNLLTCAEKGNHIVLKESNGQAKFVKIPVQFHCLPSCHGLSHFEVELYVTQPTSNISGKIVCYWGKHEVWTRFGID
jgi:hypothetical protein